MKKKLILCLAVLPLLVLYGCNNTIDDDEKYTIVDGTDGLQYELNSTNDGYVVTDCLTIETDIVIPELYNNLPVREIGEAAFKYSSVDSITLPRSLRKINDEAFYGLTDSGEGRFTSIVIPEGVKEIGRQSFYWCTSVKEITIPKTLQIIGDRAFGLNTSLSKFILEGGKSDYLEVVGNILYTANQTELICYPRGIKQMSYDVPSTVEVIRSGALYGNQTLTAINFKNNNNLKEIQERALGALSGVDTLDISRCTNLKTIGSKAFSENISLKQMVIPSSVESMGDEIFYSSYNLLLVQFKNTFTKINDGMFRGCSKLQNVTFENPSVITEIGEYAFASTGLTKFPNLPNLESIGDSAFDACMQLSTINLPSKIKVIGDTTFANCTSLISVSFPDDLEMISQRAFNRCENLQYLDLSNTKVSVIGDTAFMNCSNIAYIKFPTTLRSIGDQAFSGLHVIKTLEFNDGLLSIGQGAFDYYRDLYKVYIPASVETIKVRAFAGMGGRQDLQIFFESNELPNNVSSSFAFYVPDIDIHFGSTRQDFTNAGYVYRTRTLTLEQTEYNLSVGESKNIFVTVSTVDANETPTIPGLNWKSSDPSIASVDENGVVTANKTGKVTITISAKDNGNSVTCTVNVK